MGRLTLTYSLLTAALTALLAGWAPLAAAEFAESSIISIEAELNRQRAFVEFQAQELTETETLQRERHQAYEEAAQYVAQREPARLVRAVGPDSDNEQRQLISPGPAAGVSFSLLLSVLSGPARTAPLTRASSQTQAVFVSALLDSFVQRFYFAIRNGYNDGEARVFCTPASLLPRFAPARSLSLNFLFFTPHSGELI